MRPTSVSPALKDADGFPPPRMGNGEGLFIASSEVATRRMTSRHGMVLRGDMRNTTGGQCAAAKWTRRKQEKKKGHRALPSLEINK